MNWRLVTSMVTMAMVLVRVDSKIVVDGAWSPWSTVRSYCVDPAARWLQERLEKLKKVSVENTCLS